MSLIPEPRRLADGRVCCSHDYAMCSACQHHARGRISPDTQRASDHHHLLHQLRAAIPPDPYAGPLAARALAKGAVKDDDADTERKLAAMRLFRNDVLTTASISRRAADQPSKSEVHLHPPSPYPPAGARRNIQYAEFDGGHHPVTVQAGKRRSTIEYSEIGGRQRPVAIIEYDDE